MTIDSIRLRRLLSPGADLSFFIRLSLGCMIGFGGFCAAPALAAPCPSYGSFEDWLDTIRKKAAGAGVSPNAITLGLANVTYDPGVVSRDRGQKVFRQSFEQFAGRMVNNYRLTKGKSLLLKDAALFNRIEKAYGVPGPVLVAIWGLETDFGAYMGNFPTIRSTASLAYDCRRTEMFTNELIDALRLVQRGDLPPNQMRGAWAGEIGQTQFMPSSYMKFAVDFDGDGRRDLIHSTPDVLASTANFLKNYGWKPGQPWDEGTANFEAIKVWNKSSIYSKTIAYYANRLANRAQPLHASPASAAPAPLAPNPSSLTAPPSINHSAPPMKEAPQDKDEDLEP